MKSQNNYKAHEEISTASLGRRIVAIIYDLFPLFGIFMGVAMLIVMPTKIFFYGFDENWRKQDEASNRRSVVIFCAGTVLSRLAIVPVGKKIPVEGLSIGILMAVCGGHEINVGIQKSIC